MKLRSTALALVGAAVLAAGAEGAAPAANPFTAGVAYAACMRALGVPHPNPDRKGDFKLTLAQEARMRAVGHAKVEAADKVCFRHLRPVVSTRPLSPRAKVQATRVLEQLRTCVRKRGFVLGAPVVQNLSRGRAFFGFEHGPAGAKRTTALTRAEHACEREVQLARKLDAIVAADRAPV